MHPLSPVRLVVVVPACSFSCVMSLDQTSLREVLYLLGRIVAALSTAETRFWSRPRISVVLRILDGLSDVIVQACAHSSDHGLQCSGRATNP